LCRYLYRYLYLRVEINRPFQAPDNTRRSWLSSSSAASASCDSIGSW
jgi:hypothetical protein